MLSFPSTMNYLFALAIATFFLASCNTTIGLGRDIQKAGEGLSNSAQKAKPSDSSSN